MGHITAVKFIMHCNEKNMSSKKDEGKRIKTKQLDLGSDHYLQWGDGILRGNLNFFFFFFFFEVLRGESEILI